MKNLFLTIITLLPVAMQAMEGQQMSATRKNERLAQLRIELAQLQAADIEASNTSIRGASPSRSSINIQEIQIVEPQPAPTVQNMQENRAALNHTRRQKICVAGGVILCVGAVIAASWAVIKHCPKNQNCIDSCNGDNSCIKNCDDRL